MLQDHICGDEQSKKAAEVKKEIEEKARPFIAGGKHDVVEKVKTRLTQDQRETLQTFAMKSEIVDRDRENFQRLFSVFYYIGKNLAEFKPPKLSAPESKMYFHHNFNRLLQSVDNLGPIYRKHIKLRKRTMPLKTRLATVAHNAYL